MVSSWPFRFTRIRCWLTSNVNVGLAPISCQLSFVLRNVCLSVLWSPCLKLDLEAVLRSVGGTQRILDFAGSVGRGARGLWAADVHAAGRLGFAEDGPDEPAEFAGNGDDDFRSDDSAVHQLPGAAIQSVLCDPGDLAHALALAFLAAGEFLADFGRQAVMMGRMDSLAPARLALRAACGSLPRALPDSGGRSGTDERGRCRILSRAAGRRVRQAAGTAGWSPSLREQVSQMSLGAGAFRCCVHWSPTRGRP